MDGKVKEKCAKCAGAVGIASCTIPMFLSALGITAVGLSRNSVMGNMGNTSSGNIVASSSPLSQLLVFFSGSWGEVILMISFALMGFGFWRGHKLKPMVLSLLGAVILFTGMYIYLSIGLELFGSIVLILAYASSWSYKIARFAKLL